MENFTDKVVVITGAANGLGRATALAFGKAGALLSLADRNSSGGLQSLAEELSSIGAKTPLLTPISLGSRASCFELIDTTVAHFGGVDILINNVGILGISHLADVSEEQWQTLLNTNVSAPFWLCQQAMPHLIKRGGNIVNVTSSGASLGQAYLIPYTTSKAAVVNMTKSMAMEFINENVRINAVSPGGMHTDIMDDEVFPAGADMALINRYTGIRPAVPPSEVADLILYVASDRAKNIHGANLATDGGITAD